MHLLKTACRTLLLCCAAVTVLVVFSRPALAGSAYVSIVGIWPDIIGVGVTDSDYAMNNSHTAYATVTVTSPSGRRATNTGSDLGSVTVYTSLPLLGEEGYISARNVSEEYCPAVGRTFPNWTPEDGTYVPRWAVVTQWLTEGAFQDAVTEWSYVSGPGGDYYVTLTSGGFKALESMGFVSQSTVMNWPPCPYPGWPCLVWNGARVFAKVVVAIGALEALHGIWTQRTDCPYGWPGDDGATTPGSEWTWEGSGPPGSAEGNWTKTNPDGTKESLHPDLNHPEPKGPHWDYKDKSGRWWNVWPDGKMTPKP
jgi:hypothetical protein